MDSKTSVSAQADAIAQEIRNNRNTGKRIGDVLNQMETEHNRVERQKHNADIHNQRVESVGARYTNTPMRDVQVNQPLPFDRDAAREQLKATYPWLTPEHP